MPEELLAVYGRPRLCKDINVPTDGSLAIVYPAFGAAYPTAGLDGIRKPDALSQNRTQGARRGTGLIEPGFRPSAITSLSFASRSSLNSFPDRPGLGRQFACVICGEKEVPRDMIAQAIRASLFAIATATILGCRRPIRAVSQADGIPCPRRVQRKTA